MRAFQRWRVGGGLRAVPLGRGVEGRPLLLRHLLMVKLLLLGVPQGGLLRSPLWLVAGVLSMLSVHAAVLGHLMQGGGGDAVGLEGLVEDGQARCALG